MKKVHIIFIAMVVVLSSCDREVDIFKGQTSDPELNVIVVDSNGDPVSGATVDLYNSEDGYITETGSVATATTDGSGSVIFSEETLAEPGVFYFNVSSGTLRNWADVSNTSYILLTDGSTRVETVVAEVLPEFIALTATTLSLIHI